MNARRIAVIGSGIAGLGAAYRLTRRGHQVTLFESGAALGGHALTVDVTLEGQTAPVDVGFLVLNDRTYPNLVRLFAQLGVATAPSDMSLSIRHDADGIEWGGASVAALFAQPANALRPGFWRMLADISRFNRLALASLDAPGDDGETLAGFLDRHGFGRELRDWYLLPMSAAIWSSPAKTVEAFSFRAFATFCSNHGLLQIEGRPQWRTVVGGSADYVRRIAARLDDIRLDCPVTAVRRAPDGVSVSFCHKGDHHVQQFRHVVIACHSNQALSLLRDGSVRERELLGLIRYQPNRAVLHVDAGLMPSRRRAWSAWNHLSVDDPHGTRPVAVTYWINKLQPLPFDTQVFVTLNPPIEPARDKVIAEFEFDHPLLDAAAARAQRGIAALQGQRNTWFAGAWMGHGFHEDGLKSGYAAADGIAAAAVVEDAPAIPALAA